MSSRLIAQKIASQLTRLIGIHFGEAFPYYYVSAHPRSGGTWLSQLVSDYLRLPFPRNSVLPPLFSCVLQNHWNHDQRFRRVFYIYRDGRDVLTSLYFYRVRVARHRRSPGSSVTAKTYEKLLGRNYDPKDVVRHLPRFIEFEMTQPGRGTGLNWPDHIENWVRPGREERIAYLSYEELRRAPSAALSRALEAMTKQPADPERVEQAVENMSVKSQTGRRPGESDATRHIRKAIVGDWRNYFSLEAAEVFNELAGKTLVRLGYEADSKWIHRYTYKTS